MNDNLSQSNHLPNEPEIVERAKHDEQAFEMLYNFYFPRVYGFIFKRIGHHETAEDIVAAAFLKAFSHLGKYQHQGFTFGAWIYRIASNTLIDHYRKSGNRPETNIDAIAEPKSQAAGPEAETERQLDRAQVQKILQLLPAKEQEIIHLKFFAELSNTEIAQILNILPNHAGVKIYRAIKKFDQFYKKYAK